MQAQCSYLALQSGETLTLLSHAFNELVCKLVFLGQLRLHRVNLRDASQGFTFNMAFTVNRCVFLFSFQLKINERKENECNHPNLVHRWGVVHQIVQKCVATD